MSYNSSHTGAQIDEAVEAVLTGLPPEKGGTGQTTLKDSMNALVNSLETEPSNPQDNDYFIAQAAGGGTSNTNYYRRKMSALWNYIKSKADSVYAVSSHKHSASDVTSGTLPPERGGTGQTTLKDSMYNLIDSLLVSSTGMTDNDYLVVRTNTGSNLKKKLSILWDYIKSKGDSVYASLYHKHSTDDITSGTLSAERGGTGNTTLTNSMNALVNSLGRGTDTPTDNDYYVSQYAGGGDTTTTYHRRPVSSLWNYIKSKADSVYSASNHTHNLGANFKITEVAVTTKSISAHGYQSGASISMDAQSGYTAIGIVGWKSNSYKIRPTSHYIEDNNSLFVGFANTSTSAASAKVTFIVLWAKNTI